jgi:uncharacterized protein
LGNTATPHLRRWLGLLLIVYSVLVLFKPSSLRIKLSGWKPALAVGAAGGVIGGFSAFPGSIPVVYLGCAA